MGVNRGKKGRLVSAGTQVAVLLQDSWLRRRHLFSIVVEVIRVSAKKEHIASIMYCDPPRCDFMNTLSIRTHGDRM